MKLVSEYQTRSIEWLHHRLNNIIKFMDYTHTKDQKEDNSLVSHKFITTIKFDTKI